MHHIRSLTGAMLCAAAYFGAATNAVAQQATAFVKEEIARWGKVIKEANVKAE